MFQYEFFKYNDILVPASQSYSNQFETEIESKKDPKKSQNTTIVESTSHKSDINPKFSFDLHGILFSHNQVDKNANKKL